MPPAVVTAKYVCIYVLYVIMNLWGDFLWRANILPLHPLHSPHLVVGGGNTHRLFTAIMDSLWTATIIPSQTNFPS